MIFQRQFQQELLISANSYPIVTILGPRQSGKTTLAKATFPEKAYVNLEAPDIRLFAKTDPRGFLAQYCEGAIFDEIQHVPELLSYLQVIVDEQAHNGLYILTGSHQLDLQEEIAQSLAGRTALLTLLPLSLAELNQADQTLSLEDALFSGFYPRIYRHGIAPHRYYRDYVQTYLERDVKKIIKVHDLDQFQRFLYLCAARVGQLLDYTAFSNELGLSRHTVKAWLSVLQASFIIRKLPPYHHNFGKRVIKSSKIMFTDVGLLCYLLGIQDSRQLLRHPLRGQLFENLVILELIKSHYNQGLNTHFYFYRDSNQNEVDLLFHQGLDLIAIEIKSGLTFQPNFLKGLNKFRSFDHQTPIKSYLIYAGQQTMDTQNTTVMNYQQIAEVF